MSNPVAKWAPVAARVLFGLVFFVFGLNGFLNFMPPQPPPPPAAGAFLGGLFSASYFLPLLKGTEVLVGLALLANRFVPLALVIIAPIVLNIAGFHFLLAPAGAPIAFIVLALNLYLGWAYRGSYAPLLQARAEPTRGKNVQAARNEHALAS